MLATQGNLERVFTVNFQPSQLLFQDSDTGHYILDMKALIAEYGRRSSGTSNETAPVKPNPHWSPKAPPTEKPEQPCKSATP